MCNNNGYFPTNTWPNGAVAQPMPMPAQPVQPMPSQPNQTVSLQPAQTLPAQPQLIGNPIDLTLPDINPPTMGMTRPPMSSIMPETLAEPIYTPGYLRTQIGRLMRVEFLIGNSTTDRVGVLSAVGANYIILNSLEQQSRIVCDLFAIKFVTIIESEVAQALLGTI